MFMKKITTLFVLLVAFTVAVMAQVPVITIDSARTNDANGVPVLNGVRVTLMGTVYAPEMQGYGHNFILNNGTAGIKVYSAHRYNYTLNEGDSLVVSGVISQYKGSEEIDLYDTVATDTIYKVGTGHIDSPMVVSTIQENDESMLIEIQNVNMTTATGWVIGTHHYFTVTAGAYSIYIDSSINAAMFEASKPLGVYNIVGFGSQFKSSSPYTLTGYQIVPRSLSDFHIVTTGINNIANTLTAAVYPNPASTRLMVSLSNDKYETITAQLLDITGRIVLNENKELANGLNNLEFNTANLTNGMYVLELRTAEKSLTTKIVIAK